MLVFWFWDVLVLVALLPVAKFTSSAWAKAKVGGLKKSLFFSGLITLCIAGFVPMFIAVYFQFKNPNFTTFGEKLGVTFGIICCFLAFVFLPLMLLQSLIVPRQWLDDPTYKQMYAPLYGGIKLGNRWQRF